MASLKKCFVAGLCILITGFFNPSEAQLSADPQLSARLLTLTPQTRWIQKQAIKLLFDAHHTQGMVKIGEFFFMTAVEVSRWPRKYEQLQNGLDRDTGEGKGHIFKFNSKGELLHDLVLGEGDVYHPGGIDYDGKYIWIPVTEYRPNSFSVVYRLDPETMIAEEVLRCKESLGALVYNDDTRTLVGANWGARRFYVWQMEVNGQVADPDVPLEKRAIENPSFYVDFQDCKYLGNNLMLGSGFSTYYNGSAMVKMGGWEIFSMKDFRPIRQIPVRLWSPSGASMLNNPCTLESTEKGLKAYFVPDDDEKAVLYVYETSP